MITEYSELFAPIFRPFRPRCHRANLKLGELQCLKMSLFKHNCVSLIQDGGNFFAIVNRQKYTKITLYTLYKKYVFKVIQRRHDGTEDFDRTWMEYKNGFGDLTSEFWFGTCLIYHFLF